MVSTTPPKCDVADVLCPVQIHVHDPMVRERRRHTEEAERNDRRWIDLDEDLLDGCILIDDKCLEPGVLPDETEELLYPAETVDLDDDDDDADSHGKNEASIYNRVKRGSKKIRDDFDLCNTYPVANSHGNAYQESSSHTRYSELYSEISLRNYLEVNRENGASYSVANSHGDHSASSENRDRNSRENPETDRLTWDTRQHVNYEVANSHSNYRVFYDSQTQQRELMQASGWPTESWRVQPYDSPVTAEDEKQKSENASGKDGRESKTGNETKLDSETETEPSCDIEQCLVQIEESLLNIEQNLLHVQDLDIPELRNLLYKSPSIEKSLFEVQDLLYTDSIVPVIKEKKSLSLESEEEEDADEEEEEEEEEEEVWVGEATTVKDNDDKDDDAGAGPFDASNEETSDTANVEENNRSGSVDGHSNIDRVDGSTDFQEDKSSSYSEKINFVPNSLGKTLPRRIILDGTKENIRLCSSKPDESTTVDYNLNSMCAEKKLLCRDKCHSRTNSLDENSTFQNLDTSEIHGNGKTSLQNLFFDSTNNSLDCSGKAKSESTLQTPREKSLKTRRTRRGSNEDRWTAIEDFRRKIESIASCRRSTMSGLDIGSRRSKIWKELTESTRLREKSPNRARRSLISNDKSQDKDKDKESGGKGFDKRKRRKMSSRTQSSSENALVPSKLISLSLSLLLAALLQAVRCLTDLVEDAFKSVSYDRNGLLQ